MAKVSKEYRRLSRQELLELLIEESEKTERLEMKLAQAEKKLASRELMIEKAGSIAEAALAVNGIFDAAEEACAQYIENVRRLSATQNKIIAAREAESKKQADQIIDEAKRRAHQIETEVLSRCKTIIARTGGDVSILREAVNQADKK